MNGGAVSEIMTAYLLKSVQNFQGSGEQALLMPIKAIFDAYIEETRRVSRLCLTGLYPINFKMQLKKWIA
jgi:hypothetical protein